MIIRRAARFGGKIGLNKPFLARVAEKVIEHYSDFYPELVRNQKAILDNITVKKSVSSAQSRVELRSLIHYLIGFPPHLGKFYLANRLSTFTQPMAFH